MNREIIERYNLTNEREIELWKNSIFVFDTSALLDLYFFPKRTRNKIYKEIFEKLDKRLWLPFHVQYEYLKNRESKITKPISDNYIPLKNDIKKISNLVSKDIINQLNSISKKTKNDNKHPHIEQTEIDDFLKIVEQFKVETEKFDKEVLKKIEVAEKEITDIKQNDDVLIALETYFEIGRDFSFSEILEITKEGKHRYEFEIPPGYGDLKKKKGTQIFADLVIWKQILEFSKERKTNIIFITNDISKDNDWCYTDKKHKDRIFKPREELIKEIFDNSGVDFWMYSLSQFLFNANEQIKSSIQKETIQNISQFITAENIKSNNLIFKCDECGRVHKYDKSELELDFDCVGGSERSMGTENQYEANEYFTCKCGNDITATFEVWEYPVGAHNYESIEMENAELLKSFYFTINFFDDENEPDTCTCHHQCKDEMRSIVDFYNYQDLDNEYNSTHLNHKYTTVKYGNCEWCDDLHIRCAKCNSVTLLSKYHENEETECEGGCGLKYKLDTTGDIENLGEYSIKLIDDRIVQCSKCGTDFIDIDKTELCNECEKEYNEE